MTFLVRTSRSTSAVVAGVERLGAELPLFLCPALTATPRRNFGARARQHLSSRSRHLQRRGFHDAASRRAETDDATVSNPQLPVQCSGCGALAQTITAHEPGFYNVQRKAVRNYLKGETRNAKQVAHDQVVEDALSGLDEETLKSLNLQSMAHETETLNRKTAAAPPVCDRCHDLIHYRRGVSIQHPSVQSVRDTLAESPYKYNHVYHVIDAADFPMSLIRGVHSRLDLSAQRSHNRRSRAVKFSHGKSTDVTFVITRSDLLSPVKEHVDGLMPFFTNVLREALGSAGKNVRLGNVRCVSARRGWWTKELKEDIWNRGGAGWMVGRVNVGKSRLFESVFPKGRSSAAASTTTSAQDELDKPDLLPLSGSSLLPPAQPETNYPEMPIVSDLPGTTASPIRVPFGNGRGELIDLPGLSRGDLENFVQEEHRTSLVMRARVLPKQQVIKPGQSLLLGGFIRITPTTPNLIFLGYSFTPLSTHLTATVKAIEVQTGKGTLSVENIATPAAIDATKSAGVFPLRWDVTKKRSKKLIRSVENLPYRVMATDILIEGCGWVEIVAQVRAKELWQPHALAITDAPTHDKDQVQVDADPLAQDRQVVTIDRGEESTTDSGFPAVEVFTPEGRFIAQRPPMNAWMLGEGALSKPQKGRPRPSMKGVKKREKQVARAAAAPATAT